MKSNRHNDSDENGNANIVNNSNHHYNNCIVARQKEGLVGTLTWCQLRQKACDGAEVRWRALKLETIVYVYYTKTYLGTYYIVANYKILRHF